MRGYIEINPLKNYSWLDLPKDAKIKKVKYNSETKRIEIHYKSKSGEVYRSQGDFGFEYIAFPKGIDVNIAIVMKGEIREIIYSKVIDYNSDKLLIVISKWIKE